MKQTQEKEKSSLGHKILTGIGIVLCVILIPILVINCTLIIKSYTNKDQVPSISGIRAGEIKSFILLLFSKISPLPINPEAEGPCSNRSASS